MTKVSKNPLSTLEHEVWTEWLGTATLFTARYMNEVVDDDPFAYNETASVSLLASAAACAGFVSLAEYSTAKRKRGRHGKGPGRGDLWIKGKQKSWAFEFKQWMPTTAPEPLGRLKSYMGAAEDCAKKILKNDADAAVAGLIVPLYYVKKGAIDRARVNLRKFSADCDFSWNLATRVDRPETYLFFKIVNRWTT